MSSHTPTPWMTQACGELCPDDVMIVADLGKTPEGMQRISTVAKALSIRQTPEVTAANAEFIVRACNSHDALVAALEALTNRYCELVDSGDCGFWDSAKDEDVINARAALTSAHKGGE